MSAPANIVTQAFIEALTGERDTSMHVRFIHDRIGGGINAQGSIASLEADIAHNQALGYGAFVVVNEGGHHDKNITRIRAAFVDGDGIPLPEKWHVPPDIIVIRDATHWHAYWLTGEGFPVDQYQKQNHLAGFKR